MIKQIDFLIKKGSLLDLDLQKVYLNMKRKENKQIIKSLLKTKGKFNFSEIKKYHLY